jgi:zinc protease
MERKVIERFNSLRNPENERYKEEFNVCDNIEPIIGVSRDPELTQNSVSFAIKFPRRFEIADRNTEENVRYEMTNWFVSTLLNTRLNEAQQQPDAKFQSASVWIGDFAGDREAFFLTVNTKNNELTEGFDEALTIVEQARRFGFTATELERAKTNMMRSLESSFAERNNKRHNEFNRSAYAHFQRNAPLLSDEQWLNISKKYYPGIQVAELNEILRNMIKIGPNTLVFASGPDNVVLPDNEMLGIIIYGAGRKQLEPYVDAVTDKPLISKTIKSGKVTK